MSITFGVVALILEMAILCFPYRKVLDKLKLASVFLTAVLKLFLLYITIAVLLKIFLQMSFYQSLHDVLFGSVRFILKFHAIVLICLIASYFFPKFVELNVDVLHKKEGKSKALVFSTIFIFIAIQMLCLNLYMQKYFPSIDVDQLFFTIFAPTVEMSSVIWRFSIFMLVLIPSFVALANFILKKANLSINVNFSIKTEGILPIIIKRKILFSCVLFIFALLVVFLRFPMFEFIKRAVAPESTFYEAYYIDPAKVNFRFPEKKKNLIFIYLESFEAEAESKILQGIDLMPELSTLARENLSFSHNNGLGGPLQVIGTTNSIASCCNTHVGLPLIMIVYGNFEEYSKSLFGGAYGLGNILSIGGGYNTSYVIGSSKNSYGMATFLEPHGFPLKSLEYWRDIGKVPKDYYVWWGIEDKKVVEYAKEELISLSKQSKPFAFSVFFEDTHFPGGYVCEECEKKYKKSIHNVYACTSKRVGRFVEWIKEQPFYEDTVIVILGDHLYMGEDLYGNSKIEDLYQNHMRHAYNVFINTKDYSKFSKNRAYCTFDYFPTIIDVLGIEYDKPGLGIGRSLVKGGKTLLEELGEEKLVTEIIKKNALYKKLLVK